MTLFEEIYRAAINQRIELLSKFSSIDVRNYNGLTPAGKLASEGNFNLAMILYGTFRADVNYIARGAACGGYIEFAMKLLNEYGANVNDIVQGAACGGYIEFAMKLLNEYGANVNDIASGAACGGHIEFAMKLFNEHRADVNRIALGATCGGYIEFAMKLFNEYSADVNYIAYGAACGGYIEFAMKLFNEYSADVNDIASGAACGGQHEFAMKLLNEHSANVNDIASGAAFGGHIEFAMKLLNEHSANVNDIASGAACGGQLKFAMKLLNEHRANVNDIAFGAAHAGHIEFAMELLNKHGADVASVVQGINKYTHSASSTMQFILPIKNAEDRKKIIAIFKNAPSFKSVVKEELPCIAKKIENIYHFKQTYGVGMPQAQFLQRCPEIRAFMIQCYAPLINNGRCTKMPYALPKEIFLLITLFLAPAYLSFEGVEELLFKLQQKTLINALNSYAIPAGWLGRWFARKPVHEERAQSIQNAIQKTTSLDEMATLICKQHSMFSMIDKYNSAGETPLIIATLNKDITKVEDLLKAGANPDKPALRNKQTPLAIAVLANREDLIKCLLQYHARIDLEDIDGNTAYHLAQNNGSSAEIRHMLSAEPVAPELSKHEKPLENDTQDAYYSLLHRSIRRLD